MFPGPVHGHVVFGVEGHVTLVTLIVEHGGEVLRLHMVPGVTPGLVGELVT